MIHHLQEYEFALGAACTGRAVLLLQDSETVKYSGCHFL